YVEDSGRQRQRFRWFVFGILHVRITSVVDISSADILPVLRPDCKKNENGLERLNAHDGAWLCPKHRVVEGTPKFPILKRGQLLAFGPELSKDKSWFSSTVEMAGRPY
ncbi:MAG TPA: hypothetical protein VI756_12015, partial [Blastocatellia bacterium]